MPTRHLCSLLIAVALLPASAKAMVLIRGGQSQYVIHLDAQAPSSVREAAEELRTYAKKVTGADIGISSTPTDRMICLGDNASARKAGLSVDDIPLEGFRIAVRGASVYILGPDTPDDGQTPQGGKSAGTRNGVYSFIERFLGVRWLMPGEHGEYVPKLASIELTEIDIVEAPTFLNRRLPYIQERKPLVKKWCRRQRLGWSLYLSHGHNWTVIKPEEFKTHPDWFAERGGARVPPAGHYKLCATNPSMIRAFADRAISRFDKNPNATCYSLSPSDGGGWCECEECEALYETDPRGKQSVTPAVVTFYNEVAKLVAVKYPDKLLAGYVYAAYVFPPKKPIKLQPNVFLVWAPSFDYGFTLYRPELQKLWDDLVPQWTQVTRNISYYDLPNSVSNSIGAPNPPGIEILKFLYPRLKKAQMKGVYVYGNSAWGHSALKNYLLAKLAWNADADIDALFDDFCQKAYGAGAAEIKRFYRLLDAETKRFFIDNPTERYHLSPDRMKDLYARNFAELSGLVVTAEAKTHDPGARARLGMLGLNMKLLHWNLRQRGMLEADEESPFHVADDRFAQLLREHSGSLALQAERRSRHKALRKLGQPLNVEFVDTAPNPSPVTPCRLRGGQLLVLKPRVDGPVEVHFTPARTYGGLIWATVLDAKGEPIARGLLTPKRPFTFEGKSHTYYHLHIAAGAAFYQLKVAGAHWALDTQLTDKGLHLIQKTSPLYFDVPPGLSTFGLWLAASPPGETAIATLYSPTGRKAALFDCTAKSVDSQTISVEADESGFWKLAIEKAPTGVLDDVWVRPREGLTGYVSLVPTQALRVTRVK